MTDGPPRERLLAGLPLAERRARLAGASTVLLEGGHGPPMILLHGGIECGGVVWGPVIPALAAEHRVIVPDLPGLGESEPITQLDHESLSDWLSALVWATCDEPPVLVAHSLGGSLAARFAATRGRLLRRLIVYAAPAVGRYHLPLGLRAAAIRFGLRPSARGVERLERWAFLDLDGFRRREPSWLHAFSAYLRSRAAVPHVGRTMRRLVALGTERIPDADLRRAEVPVALVWGRHDRFVPLALAEAARLSLDWPLHVVDDAGHVPHIERPGRFLDALHESLNERRTDDHVPTSRAHG